MTILPSDHPLYGLLAPHLGAGPHDVILAERLRASRPVFRFSLDGNGSGLVGKFFAGAQSATSSDKSLAGEFGKYRQAAKLGLAEAGVIPRLLGRALKMRLGLLLEGIPGPDLDFFLALACQAGRPQAAAAPVALLGKLLAFFHTRPLPLEPVSLEQGLAYLRKLLGQLQSLGLLYPAEGDQAEGTCRSWHAISGRFPDHQVLLHGDATPTNFLFPDGRVMAVDLERLRPGDRLFDLSWVAGELKHAWFWRRGEGTGAEVLIPAFFEAYFEALAASENLKSRVLSLNPLYMALAEMRIARNSYLSWEYRRSLVSAALSRLNHCWSLL